MITVTRHMTGPDGRPMQVQVPAIEPKRDLDRPSKPVFDMTLDDWRRGVGRMFDSYRIV